MIPRLLLVRILVAAMPRCAIRVSPRFSGFQADESFSKVVLMVPTTHARTSGDSLGQAAMT